MTTATAHGLPAEAEVAAVLQRLDAGRALSGQELDQHIADCTWLMERAYDRFQQHHNPADRDEAVLWMHRRDEALRSRVEAGAGYFLDQADLDRKAMAGRAAGA